MRKIITMVLMWFFIISPVTACHLIAPSYNACVPITWCSPLEQGKIMGDQLNSAPQQQIPSFAHNTTSAAFNGVISPLPQFHPNGFIPPSTIMTPTKFPIPIPKIPHGVVPIGSPPGGDYIPPKIPRVSVPEGSTLANLFVGLLLTLFFIGYLWVRRRTMKGL